MNRRTEIVVGLVIVLGVALIFFGTLWLRGAEIGRDTIIVEARFREVGQLMRGNAVSLYGVPIGQVQDISIEPGGHFVRVRMRIDRDTPLPEDPVVTLAPKSMFGDWHAEIHSRGRFPRYVYAEGPDPDVLPGYSLPDISRLTAVADQIAENLAVITDRVEIAFTEETALNVRRAIENIQDVSEQLAGLVDTQQRALSGIADNLESTTLALGVSAAAVGDAAASVARAFGQVELALADGELAAIVDNVHRATAQVDTLSTVLRDASTEFREVVKAVDGTFRSMEAVAGDLAGGQGTLGRLLQDTLLYHQLVDSNLVLQELLKDIQDNPRKYIRLRLFGS